MREGHTVRMFPVVVALIAVTGLASCSSSHATAPDPPTKIAASPTNSASAKVSFTAPTDDGGSEIVGYTAVCTSASVGVAQSQTGTASPITVPKLSIGHAYTCAVTAKNDVGSSVPSPASSSFQPVTVPGVPLTVTSVPYGPAEAKLVWTAPKSAGGSPITSYVATPYLGSVVQPVQPLNSTRTSAIVGGLRTGGTYLFTVAAVSSVGTGAPSAKTGPMRVGSPGQPGSVTAAKANPGQIRVSFAAPANNGATINTYTAGCNSSNGGTNNTRTAKAPAAPIVVTGLTAGKSYTCVVKATNSRGTGPISPRTPAVSA